MNADLGSLCLPIHMTTAKRVGALMMLAATASYAEGQNGTAASHEVPPFDSADWLDTYASNR